MLQVLTSLLPISAFGGCSVWVIIQEAATVQRKIWKRFRKSGEILPKITLKNYKEWFFGSEAFAQYCTWPVTILKPPLDVVWTARTALTHCSDPGALKVFCGCSQRICLVLLILLFLSVVVLMLYMLCKRNALIIKLDLFT